MRKLLGLFTLIFLALNTGCSKKPEKAADETVPAAAKFDADRNIGILEGKDSKVTIVFTKDVVSVSENRDGVTAVKDGNKVVFTQIVDAPEEEKTVDFVVKGADDADNTTVAIKLARRPASDILLDQYTVLFSLPEEASITKTVAIKAGRGVLEPSKDGKRGVTANIASNRIWINVPSGLTPGDYWLTIKSIDPDKQPARLKVVVASSSPVPVKASPPGAFEPFALDDDGKLDVKVGTRAWVKIRSGTVASISPPVEKSPVYWQYEPDKKSIASRPPAV
jgi:hypothetical protein